jgi:hypothetical protein
MEQQKQLGECQLVRNILALLLALVHSACTFIEKNVAPAVVISSSEIKLSCLTNC